MGSLLETLWEMVALWVPSATLSSTAETVTVWGWFQLDESKVREEGETVTWLAGETVMEIVTVSVGWLVSTIS